MKNEPRSPSAKNPPVPLAKHQLDHAVPTVIHDPDADLPVLARWVRHAMANQTRFWTLIVGLVALVVVIAVLANGVSLGRVSSDEAWIKLTTAKTPGDRVELAKEYDKSPASQFALLQAATEFYNQGFNDLPGQRDAALPRLKQALDLFEQVEREAPQDSAQARVAALGAARTLEARNQLEKAVAKYKEVAKTWPDTDEAKEAKRLAQWLQQPESQQFYKELYAYEPLKATLPPGATDRFNLPPGHPRLDFNREMKPLFSPLLPPPPPSATTPSGSETTTLPEDVFTPSAPKEGAAQPELPGDVFAPKAKESAPK